MTAKATSDVRSGKYGSTGRPLTGLRKRELIGRSLGEATAAGSVAELLLRVAQRNPGAGLRLFDALRDEEGEFHSYPVLLGEAQRILGGLQMCGCLPGRRVVLVMDSSRDLLPAFWACMLGGYVACPFFRDRNEHESWAGLVRHLDRLLDRPLFLAAGPLCDELRAVDVANLDRLRAGNGQEAICAGRHHDLAIIALNRASADGYRATELTHGNVLASLAGKAERLALTAEDIFINWMPLGTASALLDAHMLPLYAGSTQLHVRREVMLAQPLRFLRLIHRYRASVAFAPDFIVGRIQALLEEIPPGPSKRQILKCDLFSLRHLISSVELPAGDGSHLFLDFLRQFGLVRTAVWWALALAETCTGAVYSCEFPARGRGEEVSRAAVPIAGLQMRVADIRGALARAGESGELQMRGPMVFARYYRDEVATRAAFTSDGWFRSGLLGRIEDGHIHLLGRSEDRIAVEGGRHFTRELEAALERLEGIERSIVAVFSARPQGSDIERLAVVFAPACAHKSPAKLHQLVLAVRNTVTLLWGIRSPWIVPLAKEQFTRTILGNIDHAVLRKRLEGGELTGYELRVADAANLRSGNEPMPPSDSTEASIASVYGDVLGLEPAAVSANSSFFEMGGTSLDVLKLQRELEHRFGNNSIPVGTILHNPVVRELASRVRLGRAGSHNEYHPLVPLQLGGRGTPLFCVHSDDGEVLTFVNLAKYFTDKRPLYALRARGLDAGEKVFSSLAEMVRTYVQAIRERQPRGPYAVAGYGYGGIVAFEIAKDLEAQRERVAFIGSFNQPPYFNRTVMQLETGKSSVARSLQAMGRSYVPSGTVASMSIFYAQPIDSSQRAWLNEELTEWDGLTRLRNRYIQVPGDHHSFIGPKHLSRFQSALQAELERTLGNR